MKTTKGTVILYASQGSDSVYTVSARVEGYIEVKEARLWGGLEGQGEELLETHFQVLRPHVLGAAGIQHFSFDINLIHCILILRNTVYHIEMQRFY